MIEKFLKRENGITLIALVITIIVLLILAGVSIAILTGENGILTQAQNAKNRTEEAAKQEEAALKELEEKIDGVAQVTDTEPGKLEGEGTAENPYTISSIEDLVVFSYEVTNGRTFKKEDGTKEYVQLAQSLDFNSDKSYVNPESEDYGEYGYNGKLKEVLNQTGFIPIGTMIDEPRVFTNVFSGNFDGNEHKIYNLKIQQEVDLDSELYVLVGMFSGNLGTIQNLGIEKGYVNTKIGTLKFSTTALLVAANWGEIINCYATGNVIHQVTNFSCNVGGLAGGNLGQIKNCYNEANVTAIISVEREIAIDLRAGGITGVNQYPVGALENVYNIGNIRMEISTNNISSVNATVGGITGYSGAKISNAYNIGTISNQNDQVANIYLGSVTGRNASEITNCYYLENTVLPSDESISITIEGTEKTSDQMKQNSFAENLNIGNETSIWKINSNKNQGYPILYWQ